MQEKIHFYYTNDLHSNFEHWPRVVRFFTDNKKKITAKNESCWLFDVGDHVDRFSPIAEAFMGKANVQLLNDANYDIVTIGNNEGITLAHHHLFHLYDKANFQIVCSNLTNSNDENPDWLQSTTIIESKHGVRIGVIGLTAPFNAYYHLLDWHVAFPDEVLRKNIDQLKQSTDVIILLSHLGLNEDRQIAAKYKEIDVIIGGHTHHLLRTGEVVNNTVLTAAGKHCEYVGNVILTWDHEKKVLVGKEAYTINITHLPKDKETEQTVQMYAEKANQLLGEPIIHTNVPLEVNWSKNTTIIQELTHTLKNWTKANCAMLNAGLLLESFDAGAISYLDVHRICPHPINPCVVEVNGDELLEVIRGSYTSSFTEFKLKGFGFRGEKLGRMVYSGLEIETGFHKDGHEFVKEVKINGSPLKREQIYTVATADTFTFGRLLPEIAKSETKIYFLPEFIRDLLVVTLKNGFHCGNR